MLVYQKGKCFPLSQKTIKRLFQVFFETPSGLKIITPQEKQTWTLQMMGFPPFPNIYFQGASCWFSGVYVT